MDLDRIGRLAYRLEALVEQLRVVLDQPARMFERAFGAPDQLAAVRQPGQGVEIGQVADAVFGHAPIGDVLDDAGVADGLALLVEFGLGLDVYDT